MNMRVISVKCSQMMKMMMFEIYIILSCPPKYPLKCTKITFNQRTKKEKKKTTNNLFYLCINFINFINSGLSMTMTIILLHLLVGTVVAVVVVVPERLSRISLAHKLINIPCVVCVCI